MGSARVLPTADVDFCASRSLYKTEWVVCVFIAGNGAVMYNLKVRKHPFERLRTLWPALADCSEPFVINKQHSMSGAPLFERHQ